MRKENIDDIMGLSPMQQLMLTHSLTATGSRALSNQFRYRIRGALDPAKLAAAWQRLVDRHGALRTCFLWEGLKEPVQVVRSRAKLGFDFVDLSQLPERDREARLNALLEDDRLNGFDLRRAPLMRVSLIQLAADDFTLLWSRHHLILDRWCVDILFDELFEFYAAAQPALSRAGSFRDYIRWVQGQDTALARAFWREAFAGCGGPSLLFGDHGVAAAKADGLAQAEAVLAPAAYGALKDFARAAKLSLASVLQGGLALVVSGHTGMRDVVFGVTVSGRPSSIESIETTLGSFINNVPARVGVDPQARVAEWLQSIQHTQLRRYAYDYLSPAAIHDCTGFDASRPMFDVLAILHSPATEQRQGPGFIIEQVAGPLDSAYPLTLSLAENRGELEIIGAYDPAVVETDRVRSILNDLAEVLHAFIGAGESPLGDIIARCAIVPTVSERTPQAAHATHQRGHDDLANAGEAALNLSRIWSRILGIPKVGLDDDFFALGGTSIQAAMLFTEIESTFGANLPISTLFKSGNIRKLLEVLGRPVPRVSSLVEIQPHGGPPAMFVVPGVGGNVVSLEPVARALGRKHPYYGLQSKGLDGQEQPSLSIEQIATDYIDEMKNVLSEPFVLCGICWGALVAFEMAQQLRRAGTPPALLLILDPIFDVHKTTRPFVAPNRFTVLAKFVLKRMKLYWTTLRDIEPGTRLDWLGKKLRALGRKAGTEGLLHGNRSELTRKLVSERNITAMQRYAAQTYPDRASVLLTRDRDAAVDRAARERFMHYVSPETPVVPIPGSDSGDAISGNNAAILAAIIRREIERASAPADDNGP